MADTREAVASRLHDFIQSAQREKKARFSTQIHVRPLSVPRKKTQLLMTCEECLGKLTDDERGELDRIIQKMSGVFGPPSGAIPPTQLRR